MRKVSQFAGRAFCLLLFFLSATITIVNAQPTLVFTSVINSGLSAPIDIVNAGDGTNRIFIVERGGTIKVYDAAYSFIGTFLTIPGLPQDGERGLLSMAFHPAYATNGYFFVYYTRPGDNALTIARYHVSADPNVADPTGVEILTVPHNVNNNHNGGKLNFGSDGDLYLGTGDGGGGGDMPNNAQTGTILLGKVLRVNVDNFTIAPFYTVPSDNPYVSDPTIADEVWALGVRNPFRWSFDRLTHDMWIADVGQNAWEEINFRAAGTTGGINYGWRCYEGTHPFNTAGCAAIDNYVQPIFEYPHNPTTGGNAVVGGFVYRGTEYPELYGYYVCVDEISNNAWLIKPDGAGGFNVALQPNQPAAIVAFGETENAELYAVSIAGTVYRVTAGTALPATIGRFGANCRDGNCTVSWTTLYESNLDRFSVEYSTDGLKFREWFTQPAAQKQAGADYTAQQRAPVNDVFYTRLRWIETTGNSGYSQVVKLVNNSNKDAFRVIQSTGGAIRLQLFESFTSLALVDGNGRYVWKKNVSANDQFVNIDRAVPTGIYTLVGIKKNGEISRLRVPVL